MNEGKFFLALVLLALGIGLQLFVLHFVDSWHQVGTTTAVETVEPYMPCNYKFPVNCYNKTHVIVVTYTLWTQDGKPNETYTVPNCNGPVCGNPGHSLGIPVTILSWTLILLSVYYGAKTLYE